MAETGIKKLICNFHTRLHNVCNIMCRMCRLQGVDAWNVMRIYFMHEKKKHYQHHKIVRVQFSWSFPPNFFAMNFQTRQIPYSFKCVFYLCLLRWSIFKGSTEVIPHRLCSASCHLWVNVIAWNVDIYSDVKRNKKKNVMHFPIFFFMMYSNNGKTYI